MTADDLPAAFASLPAAWRAALPGWTPAACADVVQRVRAVSADRPIAPTDPFRALRLVSPESAKVVIFGQDPYPRPGHADGLAFSAAQGKPFAAQALRGAGRRPTGLAATIALGARRVGEAGRAVVEPCADG